MEKLKISQEDRKLLKGLIYKDIPIDEKLAVLCRFENAVKESMGEEKYAEMIAIFRENLDEILVPRTSNDTRSET